MPGAKITHRYVLKPRPVTPRRSTATPIATAPVIRRSVPPAPRISGADEVAEYQRRLDWYGDTVAPEAIIEHMRIELATFRRYR